MKSKQFAFWASALLIVVLLVAACAPRAGGGDTLELQDNADLSLDLPALVIDFDSEGQPSVANIPLGELGEQFAPGVLDSLVMPSDVVQFMTDSNIQHMQISNSPQGLILLVNGQAIPSLKWDGGELENTAQVVNLLGADLGAGMVMLENFLPLVSNLGIGIIARFPMAEGVAEVPFHIEDADAARLATQQIQESFLAAVDNPPSISIPIYYDAQGSWRVGDLTYAEWISLTGMPVFDSFRIKPEAVDRLMQQGITEFTLATDVDGVHVSINGSDLPYIGWADGELRNALDLAEQVGLWDTLSEQNMNVEDIVAMVEVLLPVVQATEITITAHFPKSIASAVTN